MNRLGDQVLPFTASYGEMSRRSGVAAEEDNPSDISPSFKINDLRAACSELSHTPALFPSRTRSHLY